MRETKFKAWLKDEKKIVEVKEIIFYPEKQIAYNAEYRNGKSLPFHYLNYKLFENIELLQHICLKDKNGVEIYDGYILKDNEERFFVIEYKFGGFNLVPLSSPLNCLNDEFSWNPLGDMQTATFVEESCEVIGNIYENLELLEK